MQRETADPENRLFLIFLDDYHTRIGNSQQIRHTLAKFVGGLTPRDLVAVLYPLTPIGGVTFSRDHDGTAVAMMNFQGRKYNYNPKYPYESQFAHFPAEFQEQMRNDIVIRSLRSACALLSSLREGRKSLLFVSEGLVANLPQGAQTMGGAMPPPRNPLPTPTAQQERQQMSREWFNATALTNMQNEIFSTCSRGNASIYALDPRGLAPTEFGAADVVGSEADRRVLNEALDSLRTLAERTDGRAIIGKNNPLPALQQMVEELGTYYLLVYTSSIAPRDGRFHPIDVKVNRRDVEVRHRQGYWAYTEEEIRLASAPPRPGPPIEVAQALDDLAAVVEPRNRRSIALWFGAVRGPAENPEVTLVWETIATGSTDPAERVEQVSITATAGGKVLFEGRVPRDATAFRPAGRVSFAAPSGPIRMRLVTEGARGQRLDSEDINEIVPDFTTADASVTAPLIFRARTASQAAQLRGSTTALPAAARSFSRTERLVLRFDAYGPAGTTPQIAMRLLNKLGEPTQLALPAPVHTAGHTFETELILGALPPGDYLIEIAATSGTGKSARLVGIRITS
jgi:VWFA-related protein